MGKKRIVTQDTGQAVKATPTRAAAAISKKKLSSGIVYIQATYNNTKIVLTDEAGNVILWSSSGALGFTGTKRGTPFAASKVAEWLVDRAAALGLKEVAVVVKGVGAGRESALRTLGARGLVISSIKDATPIPFNGPRAPKPRRV
jgi:small subunit ribosomal protein S11